MKNNRFIRLRSRKKGFTLIEIMVVVSSVGVIMMIVVGTVLQTMRAQNRNEGFSKLNSDGNWILGEIRRNIFNSNGKVTCQNNGLSVGLTSLSDGLDTILSCDASNENSQIASTSGTIVKKLNPNGLEVVDCTNFAVCTTSPDTGISSITFSFKVKTTVSGVGVSQKFVTTLTTRN